MSADTKEVLGKVRHESSRPPTVRMGAQGSDSTARVLFVAGLLETRSCQLPGETAPEIGPLSVWKMETRNVIWF